MDESGQLGNEPCRNWAERRLSESGFSSYIDVCDNEADLAFELHEWNLMLRWALVSDNAHVEYVPRNAYDRVLAESFRVINRAGE